jgi:predicted NAD/FAD-binding protein
MARIAVVGGGIAGLGATWALDRRHDVVLYEAEPRIGGHSNTVEVHDDGRTLPVDTGFIVYNERNYPNLVRLFDALEVPTEPSDMSFSVSVAGGGFEYRSRARGLFAQPSNALRPDTWRMLRDFRRFCQDAPHVLASGTRESLGSYLERRGYSEAFRLDLLLPVSAAIWSSGLDDMLEFPVTTLLGFLMNHDILQVRARPRWRTVSGGSREYVRRLTAGLDGIRRSRPVVAVRRSAEGVVVHDDQGDLDRFDEVVFATHADTTLEILGSDASPPERAVLGSIRFQRNEAVLHRDPALMPLRRGAWASWNYLAEGRSQDRSRPVSLTYWMNRLQNLRTRRPVFVTLNPIREPRGEVQRFSYSHPQFDRAAVDAQARLPQIQGLRHTWFAGAWCGHGFHEDGLRSGLSVAEALGAPAPWIGSPVPVGAAA